MVLRTASDERAVIANTSIMTLLQSMSKGWDNDEECITLNNFSFLFQLKLNVLTLFISFLPQIWNSQMQKSGCISCHIQHSPGLVGDNIQFFHTNTLNQLPDRAFHMCMSREWISSHIRIRIENVNFTDCCTLNSLRFSDSLKVCDIVFSRLLLNVLYATDLKNSFLDSVNSLFLFLEFCHFICTAFYSLNSPNIKCLFL